MDKTLMNSFANAITALASISALKDIFLETKEQKDLFNEKFKINLNKLINDYQLDIGVQNQEYTEWLFERLREIHLD